MKRDDELIKEILISMEDDPSPLRHFDIGNTSDEEDVRVYFHYQILVDKGFLHEWRRGTFRMTADGHEFVGMMRDDVLWSRMRKQAASQFSKYGLRLLYEIGNEIIKQKFREAGLLPSG